MLNPEALVGRKGVLGSVWVAAYFEKRLKKELVDHTNISSSVDKILQDAVPLVTYRVLGFLLLGVVRLYSKKVHYMSKDCLKLKLELKEFGKKNDESIEATCAHYHSITRPKSFQLDAFDLQILEEEATSVHIRPNEDITIAEAWKDGGSAHHSRPEYLFQEDDLNFETCSAVFTPASDNLWQHSLENEMIGSIGSPSRNLSYSEVSIEKIMANYFSPEKFLDPIQPGKVQIEPQLEKGEENGVLEPEESVGVEEKPSYGEDQQVNSAEQMKLPEMISPERSKWDINSEDRRVSITIEVDVTPKPKGPTTSAASTLEFMAVRTPATKESVRGLRKRKCLCDDIIVLPNRVLKESIEDASDLIRERRNIPHACLHVWKIQKHSNLAESLLQPLLPYSAELTSLFSIKNLKISKTVEVTEAPESLKILDSPVIHSSLDQAVVAPSTPVIHRSPSTPDLHRSPDQTDIAPATPVAVTHSSSLKLHDGPRPTSSCESMEEEMYNNDNEFSISQMNEEINSSEGESWEMSKWSMRTRMMARSLCKNFAALRKQKEEEVVKLSQILEGKSKTESAKLFYEILVLRSGGYVDLKQQRPYDDIIVLGTSKFKKFCDDEVHSSR